MFYLLIRIQQTSTGQRCGKGGDNMTKQEILAIVKNALTVIGHLLLAIACML